MSTQDSRDTGRGKQPRLDRWGTLNWFTGRARDSPEASPLSLISGGSNGSPATAVVWLVLFAMASGASGLIKGASVTKLAALTGLDRVTVRKAIARLLKDKHITVHEAGKVPVYHMKHCEQPTGD